MIVSFSDRETELFFKAGRRLSTGWQTVVSVAARTLDLVQAAMRLEDLRSPPGKRLEALRGDRAGQDGIRVNDQWCVCFTWTDRGPVDVEITDHH